MKAEDIRNISVIGAGFMGPGIAQIFASKHYAVRLMDIKDELLPKAVKNIRSNLLLMAKKGLLPEKEIDAIMGRIKITPDIGEATSNVQLVIECITENLELKQKVFRDLDRLCSQETILATNTSVLSITEIAAKARNKERILGTHFWNPPHIIPLVEVVKGRETSEEVVETIYQLLKNAGKHPVKVMKDIPGFVGNRLQHALWREAMSIVENGIAEPATVDEVIKEGFGIRLPVLGPLENADMIGLDLTLAIHDYILKYLNSSPNPSPLLRQKVAKGELGFKTGQGFYTWSAEEAQRSREHLLEYLLDRVREEQNKTT
jgi:3-hydroxybutyryl-CoA dehydrogenase